MCQASNLKAFYYHNLALSRNVVSHECALAIQNYRTEPKKSTVIQRTLICRKGFELNGAIFCVPTWSCTHPCSATAMVRAGALPWFFAPPALVLLETEHNNVVLNNNNLKKQHLCSIRQLPGHLALLNQFGFGEGSIELLHCSCNYRLAASRAQEPQCKALLVIPAPLPHPGRRPELSSAFPGVAHTRSLQVLIAQGSNGEAAFSL